MSGKLDGEVAIVTGAARGMGAAEARLFAAEGASVVLADLLDEDGAALADELGARYVHLDVRSASDWSGAVAAAGDVTVLVNNAGIFASGGAADVDPETFMDVVAVNQLGTVLGIRAVVPSMRRAGHGSIVNISSTGGLYGMRDSIAYVASKWAVRGLTRAAALDLGPEIRVNAICPGPIDSPMLTGGNVSGGWERVVAASPLGRVGSPDEIARVALFLASGDSSFVTGTELVADGGRAAGPGAVPA
jgi:3alpha(or 20beta)-hydroxysteroid dehydrogenase